MTLLVEFDELLKIRVEGGLLLFVVLLVSSTFSGKKSSRASCLISVISLLFLVD